MKKIILTLILVYVVLFASVVSGNRSYVINVDEPFLDSPLLFKIPQGFPKPELDVFAKNHLSEAGFQLGRKLFYDGRLSKDGNFSCASCHQQYAAFATSDHDLSHGFNNSFTTRNAPALINIAWMRNLHFDGAINHIELQPLAPMTAPNEMAENVDSVLAKLKKNTAYKRMFKAAFGTTTINSQRMLKALAQFVGNLISADSKYDKVKRGEDTFAPVEENGYRVFKLKCEACHREPLFTDNSFRNNGLPLNNYLCDAGRMNITGNIADSLKFKVPTLRNIARTYPYMHDGRFYSLNEVIDHYRNGIQKSATLDSLLINKISITDIEKRDLIYFLKTLTDNTFLKNPRFSQPL